MPPSAPLFNAVNCHRRRRQQQQEVMERLPPSLPDDLIAEILARVPYKSLCSFKCVSRPWLALCSDPGVRRSGAIVFDCCNGLLLCKWRNAHSPVYFVYNPATEEWMDLPVTESTKASNPIIRLGFDPAVSSHFRVLLVVHVEDEHDLKEEVTGAEIYSSETGEWTYRPSEWGVDAVVRDDSRSAFFNGTLHLTTTLDSSSAIVRVATDGKTCV